MIKLNVEYTYKKICMELGWRYQKSNNATKQKQIKTIEESFEFYHPINPKTKKEKKSYIFVKQIKEPVLNDGRKNNGGHRNNSGRKYEFPEEEFDYLWKIVAHKAYHLNKYYEREWNNKVYFTQGLLFREFGFDFSSYKDKAKFSEDDDLVKYYFEDIIYDVLKANTVGRLCKRYDLRKNSLPKGILRSRSRNRLEQMISDDKLISLYNEFENACFLKLKCKDIKDVLKKNKYNKYQEYIEKCFNEKHKYNVKRFNVIQVNDFEVYREIDLTNKAEYQKHFRKVIFKSVEKSIKRRIEDNTGKYKNELNYEQKKLLKKYLDNMLERITDIQLVDYETEEFEWLKLVC